MKKSIFIAIHYLEIGGAEISLIGFLQSIDYSKYDVDLFIYSHRGELIEYIPKQVNVLKEIGVYAHMESSVGTALKRGYFRLVVRRVWAKIRYALYKIKHPSLDNHPLYNIISESVLPILPKIGRKEGYDLAISYLQPHYIVLEKVRAAKKVCWIHTDYACIGVDVQQEIGMWNAYDSIVSISEDVTNSFLSVFPSLKNKILLLKNILSADFVCRRTLEIEEKEVRKEMPEAEGVVNLLSVGRFCYAKNYDNVPDICRRIINKGCRVCWYLIGYGSDEELIRKKIKEAGVENSVVILGKKANPYPYIKACDIYVQPSRFEGNSVTVREAQILAKPVVITAYPTSGSQVEDGQDGFIVPQDNEGCAAAMAEIIKDKVLIEKIRAGVVKKNFENKEQIKVLDTMFRHNV